MGAPASKVAFDWSLAAAIALYGWLHFKLPTPSLPSFRGMSAGENCSVCYDVMTENNIYRLICGHALHYRCYQDCLDNQSTKCPICRKEMRNDFPGGFGG